MTTSATAAVARARRRAHAIALSDRTSATVLLLLVAALVAHGLHTFGDIGADTGYDQAAGARVADGQLPYADFTYYYGPLAPAVTGLVALVSPGLTAQVAVGVALAAAIVAATWVLARRWSGPLGGLLAGALTAPVAFAPTNFSYALAHSISAPLAILLALTALIALDRRLLGDRWGWTWVAGAATGLMALTRPEFEAAIVIALAVWLALRWRGGLPWRREALAVAVPAVAIPALVYGALLLRVSAHDLVVDNLYPRDQLTQAGNAVLRIHAPFTAGSLAELAGRVALYALGVGAIVGIALLVRRGGAARALGLGAGTVAAVAAVAAATVRPEAVRHGLEFAWGWIPGGAAAAVVVLVWRRLRRRDGGPAAESELLLTVVLAVLAATTYAVFFVASPKAQPAVYAVPFAAVFLTGLHLGRHVRLREARVIGACWLAFLAAVGLQLTVRDADAESAVVRGPGGALAATPADASAYQAAVDLVDARTAPGEAVLFAPQLTALSLLADRPSPLREISVLPGALPTPAAERDAIARMGAAGVRLAVIDTRPFAEYGHGSFGQTFDRELAAWIRQHFVKTTTLTVGGGSRALQVWQRSSS